MELDPVFIRALRLLHSNSKESGMQLKAMLDESIRMKKNPGSAPSKISTIPPQQGRDLHVKDNTDRRNLDKLKRDLSELVPENKKPRLHSPARSSPGMTASGGFSKSHTPSPTLTPTLPNLGEHPSGGNSSAEELDLDMDLEGLNDLTCCICKTLNQGNGNKLMECHTCQNLYHQECHYPVIPNQEADDPRLVWNCSTCSGPPVPKVPHSSTKPSSSKPSKTSLSLPGLKTTRPAAGRSDASTSGVFKRTDSSKSHGSGSASGSGGKPAGMAALAASYKGSSGAGGSSGMKSSSRSGALASNFGHVKSSTGGSSSSTSSTIMSADKRLQLMKKKAAQRKK